MNEKDNLNLENDDNFTDQPASSDSNQMPDLMSELAKIVDPNYSANGQTLISEEDHFSLQSSQPNLSQSSSELAAEEGVPDFIQPQSLEAIIDDKDLLDDSHDDDFDQSDNMDQSDNLDQSTAAYSSGANEAEQDLESVITGSQESEASAENVSVQQFSTGSDTDSQHQIPFELSNDDQVNETEISDDLLQMDELEQVLKEMNGLEEARLSQQEVSSTGQEQTAQASADLFMASEVEVKKEELPQYDDLPSLPDMELVSDLPDNYAAENYSLDGIDTLSTKQQAELLQQDDHDMHDFADLDVFNDNSDIYDDTKSGSGYFGKVASVIGLLIAVAAGYMAFGYWSNQPPEEPPIIEAQNAKAKIRPEPQATTNEADNKAVYNQVEGTESASNQAEEKIVSREEAILPENAASLQNEQVTTSAEANNNSSDIAVNENGIELRPVKTVRIGPDGNIIEEPASPASNGATEVQQQQVADSSTEASNASDAPRDVTQKLNESQTATTGTGQAASQNETQVAITNQAVSTSSNEDVQGVSDQVKELLATAKELQNSSGVVPPTPRVRPVPPVQTAVADPATTQSTSQQIDPNQSLSANTSQTATQPSQEPVQQQTSTSAESTQANTSPQQTASSEFQQQAAPAGAYFVQLTAQRSNQAAQTSFTKIQSRNQELLGSVQTPFVQLADLGTKGIYYRAGVLVNSKPAAQSFCQALKSRGTDCLVRQP